MSYARLPDLHISSWQFDEFGNLIYRVLDTDDDI